jgi:hypothetical protein
MDPTKSIATCQKPGDPTVTQAVILGEHGDVEIIDVRSSSLVNFLRSNGESRTLSYAAAERKSA